MVQIMIDYHFNIKELANKFEGQFECLGGKTKKSAKLFPFNKNYPRV